MTQVSVQPEEHRGYDCKWDEYELSDNWREELKCVTGADIIDERKKRTGLHVYFDDGRKAIVKSS